MGSIPQQSGRRSGLVYLGAVLALTALLQSAGYHGYWISDDFGNIHQFQTWSDQERLWAGLSEKMTDGNTPAGAFLRPATQAVRGLTWLVAGPAYSGWFTVSWLVHLANTWLIMSLLLRILPATPRPPYHSAALAGLLFGLSPVASEGVYWIAAGGDAWVTLLTLIALHSWFSRYVLLMPLCFLVALGFKESAGVLPLQLALLLFAPQHDGRMRSRVWAVGICMLVLGGWLLVRSGLFGEAWSVYRTSSPAGLPEALRSIPSWWAGLTAPLGLVAGLYAASLALGGLAGVICARHGVQVRLLVALLLSTAGLLTATFLNLGGLLGNGEGGRLFLTPMAWLALSLGVAFGETRKPCSSIAQGLLSVAVITGIMVLNGQYRELRQTQDATRQFVSRITEWADRHPGSTLLIIPEHKGRLPVFRNAQSGLVMPPVQPAPLLHRVVPTLDSELRFRHAQLAGGLLTRIVDTRPDYVNYEVVLALLEPTAASWPEHYACWSWQTDGIQLLSPPSDHEDGATWLQDLARQAELACGISISVTLP